MMSKLALPDEVKSFLDGNNLAAFATTNFDHHPELAFVYYLASRDHDRLYLIARSTSHKVQNLISQPRVALAIVDHSDLITLQLSGIATLITDDRLALSLLDKFAVLTNSQSDRSFPPVTKLSGGSIEVINIALTWYRYSSFTPNPPQILQGELTPPPPSRERSV